MRRLLLLFAVVLLALPAGAMGATTHTVDLATGRVDGHRVLGRTIAGVTAALGRPDFRSGLRPRYTLGWGTLPNFSIEVFFHPSRGVERAWSIGFEQRVRDVKLGDLLGRTSAALQAGVRNAYGATFALVRPYACKRGRCVGEFAARSGSLHLTLGTQAATGTWLTVWQASAT